MIPPTRDKRHHLHSYNDEPGLIDYKNYIKIWYHHGKKHRNGGPAVILYKDINFDKPITKEWWNYGRLHRVDGGPAIDCQREGRVWYKNGKVHRDDNLPAVILNNGDTEWWVKGKRHRDNDQPACITSLGLEWYKDGKLHRQNSPAWISSIGELIYCVNGDYHRDDGPALITEFAEEWWANGKLHRLDGPAIIKYDPKNRSKIIDSRWVVNDVKINDQEISKWLIDNKIKKFPLDKKNTLLFRLTFL